MNVGDFYNPKRLFCGAFVPDWLLRRKEISCGAKLLFAVLTGECDERTGVAEIRYTTDESAPDRLGISERLGVSERTCRDYLKELLGEGLVVCERRGLGLSNLYRFPWHEWADDGVVRRNEHPDDHRVASDPERNRGSDQERSMGSGQQRNRGSDPTTKKDLKKEEREKENPQPPLASDQSDPHTQAVRFVNEHSGLIFNACGGGNHKPILDLVEDYCRHGSPPSEADLVAGIAIAEAAKRKSNKPKNDWAIADGLKEAIETRRQRPADPTSLDDPPEVWEDYARRLVDYDPDDWADLLPYHRVDFIKQAKRRWRNKQAEAAQCRA